MNRITFKRKAEKSLLLILFLFVLSFQVKAQPPSGGLGTEPFPYIIATLDDLKWIADQVNGGVSEFLTTENGNNLMFSGKYFKQTANIDAAETSGWNSGTGWIAIGAGMSNAFSGSYDGQGYTISNLYVNNSSHYGDGLFAQCLGATIKNLGLTNISINSGDYVGGLVGYIDKNGTVNSSISNCYVTGSVTAKNDVGGLIGEADNTTIDNCYAECTVTCTGVGYLMGAGGGLMSLSIGCNISNSYASGSVTVSNSASAGGFSGGAYDTNISSCYSSCVVSTNGVGYNGVSVYSSNIGAFLGTSKNGTILNCYANGSISANGVTNVSQIGGFVGLNGTSISYCYTTSSIAITGTSDPAKIGGFVGVNDYPDSTPIYGVVNANCYWNSTIFSGNGCGTNPSGATFSATGKTTAAMQTQSIFTGWDFVGETANGTNDYWKRMDTKNNKYPYLEWQVLPFTAAVSTTAISTYGVTSATMGGNITADGGATVTERGVVYSSTDATPTIGETGVTKNANGTGIGSFSKSITGLSSNTTYNACAYATNSAGTSYGTATSFSTLVPVPTVTGILPSNGPTTGTTSVTITGADLTAASAVMFGGTNAIGFTVNSATQITATAPAGSAGTVDITVTTAGGTSATSASDQFTYVAAPTITGISTTSGPTVGGTSVVITGTNFLAASAVRFGATNATGYTINSATQITATSPAGSAGAVDITVTTAGGTSATSGADQFTYVAAPTITGISTTTGPTVGSTSVVITGTNFLAASAVKFGATNATGYTINSATQITATAPAGSAGSVDITVSTAGGTSATSSADQFTYVAAPTITGISTTSGPTAGSTSVVITGTNFLAASAVKFGATNATGYTINSATQITATAPARSAGVVDITVSTAGGTSATSSADQFTYVAAPAATTNAATSISSTGATLNGSINAKNGSTTVTFEYGLTTSYGTTVTADQSPVTGSAATPVSKAITGLAAGVTYHYRVVGVNAGGRTNGLDKSFTTPLFAGNGTPEDPYPIATLADLKWVSEHSDIWNGSFVQTADIDASTTSTWNASKGFSPIGDVTTKFTGSYNGQYHTITGLTINRPGGNDYNIGLFGVTTNATLKNIGLPDCSIIGGYNVGALVGYMGYNSIRTSSISDCYCTGEVSGISYVGGLVGASQTTGITNCYSTCKVTATANAAGLVNFADINNGTTITNCFYDSNTSEQSDTGKGTPKTTVEMKMQSTFTGWDFAGETANGTADIWAISSTQNNGYPCFKSQITSPTAPTVTTQAVTDIATTTATGNGDITGLGVPNPGSHGICWGTSANPTIIDNTVVNKGVVSATGAFSAPMTGLTPNTLYHVRAYATNSTGTVYGNDVSFTTQSTSQTIFFGALDTKTYGDAPYDLTATSTSGLAISYSSNNTAVARVSGSTVTIVGAGTANITASQAGNATYAAAANVIQQLTINKKALSVTAITDTKTYDGTTVSTAIPTVGTLATDDAINVAPAQAFDNANVGTTHVLTASGLTIKRVVRDNAPALDKTKYKIRIPNEDVTSNYDISYITATGTINKKAVTVTAVADTKTYDGTTVSTAIPTVGTLATGDAINVAPTQAFDNAAVGTTHGLTASGLTIKNGTTDATSNYDISYTMATGTINKKAVTVTATTDTKTYDGTTVSKVTPAVEPLAVGDEINVTPTQAFDNASAGTTHVLVATGLTIKNGSTDVTGNYNIQYVSAGGSITAKALTITLPNLTLSKVYDGNNLAIVSAGTLSGVIASDAGNVTVTALGSYDNVSVGTNKTITISYILSGSAAGNYSAPADYVVTGAQISNIPSGVDMPAASDSEGVTAYPTQVVAGQVCTVKVIGITDLDLQGAVLNVHTMQGVRVYHSTKVESFNSIYLPSIDGMYLGRVTTAKGKEFQFKVIVTK